MTIKELYEWAKENHVEDYDIYARTWDGSYIQVVYGGDIGIDDKQKEISLL